MKTKTILIVGMAGVALYLVYEHKDKKTKTKDSSFREGYVAGWLTPGPLTVVALAGLAHTYGELKIF